MEPCLNGNEIDERKLWIGNLDPRVSEYQLLKLVQTHGNIEKFDLIFHRSGPHVGQPRGYAFVTYAEAKDALKAKNVLNGKLVGHKKIAVMWAKNEEYVNYNSSNTKTEISIPVLAIAKEPEKSDRISRIQAIEAKLKLMDQKEDELKINESIATKPPVIQQFQFNKDRLKAVTSKQYLSKTHKHRKPYTKVKSKS